VYTDTTGTETYLDEEAILKWHDMMNIFLQEKPVSGFLLNQLTSFNLRGLYYTKPTAQ